MECFNCRPSGKEPEFRQYCDTCKLKAARASVLDGLCGGTKLPSHILKSKSDELEHWPIWKSPRKIPKLRKFRRRYALRIKYGITVDQYNRMLEAQDNKCLVCGTKSAGGRQAPGQNEFHVDHCHTTGVVRGLLCSKCNIGLGYFDDNPERMEAAAAYIRSSLSLV